MKLSETTYDNSETGCCAPLDPEVWEGRELVWENKPFLKDHIREFLHVPLNFGSVMTRDTEIVESADAWPEEPITLTDEVSPWGADLYIAVDRDELPGATVEHLNGTFVTKAFEGPYRKMGEWEREMRDFVTDRGQSVEKMYFYYATCPSCAKKLGANRVVLFAKVG